MYIVFLCRVFLFVQTFVSCLLLVFRFFVLDVSFFSKIEYLGSGLSFDFFVFYLVVVKLESGFQKNNLSSFNLVLIWFGYRGIFFLSHAISLWFCDVSLLRWLVRFTIKFLPTGLKESLLSVKVET